MLLYSAEVQKKNKNFLLVLIICFGSFFLKSLIFIPDINLGSNVFIGGEKYKESVFGKNLPEEIFNKMNKDFMDEFTGGNYLVEAIEHEFGKNGYIMRVRGTKDSLLTYPIDDLGDG